MGARAVVGGVVVLGVLAVGAVVADGVARGQAEDQAATIIQQQLGLAAPPDVEIAGFPFLPQLMARSLDDVRATAPDVTFDGVQATDVAVTATGVGLDAPYPAGTVRLEATVPTASVQQVVGERTQMDVTVDGGMLRATGTMLGMELTAGLTPRVQDGRLLVDVQDVTVGPATLKLEQLPGDVAERLVGIEVPLEGLPQGVQLQDAVVVPDGVRFTAGGTDLQLEQVAP